MFAVIYSNTNTDETIVGVGKDGKSAIESAMRAAEAHDYDLIDEDWTYDEATIVEVSQ